MLTKKTYWVSLVCLLLLTSSPASAQMSTSHSEQISKFHPIEQPLSLKVAVTIGGLALIGLELWWFIFNNQAGIKPHKKLKIKN
jgi:plastocyanin domain-containing protein